MARGMHIPTAIFHPVPDFYFTISGSVELLFGSGLMVSFLSGFGGGGVYQSHFWA